MSKFDIENFPTSETAKRMLRRVSPVYENSYFMKWIYQVMGTEWDEAREIVESLREQAFTQTVTWGIEMQEHAYSITPDDSLSLEERRARLYRKKTKKFPLNPGVIEQYIKNGWGMTTDVDETYAPGYIRLGFLDFVPESVEEMLKDLRRIKPSHLTLAMLIERELHMDGEDSRPRLGIVTAKGGLHHISPALPEDQEASLLMALMPWRTGIRKLYAGTNEFTEPIAFAARFGQWRGGRVDIAADEDDLPQWYKDVWTSRMAPAVGFGARIKGVQRLAPMPPDTEAGRILIRSAMHMAGIRQYGLAPPEDSMAVLRTGILLSANGNASIHADADDIAAVRSRILDGSIIVPHIGITGRRNGKHHIGLEEPEQAAFMLAAGFFHAVSGRTDIRAAPEDLPQGRILDPAKGILRLGIKETRHGRRIYAVGRFDDSAAGIGIGVEERQRKRNTLRVALPDDSAASIAIGTAGAIGGRQRISADAGDVPDWCKDVLDGSVAAFRIGSIETFRKHRERIAPEFPEESGGSLGVGTITARYGRRDIAAEKSDIPSHDILKTSKAKVSFGIHGMWNGKTVVSPAPMEEPQGGEIRMGIMGMTAGRTEILADADDIPAWRRDILQPSAAWIHAGVIATRSGRKLVKNLCPEEESGDVHVGLVDAGMRGRAVIATQPDEISNGMRIGTGMGHLVTGRIVIGCDPDDLRPVKAGILPHVGLMHVGTLAVG